MNKIDFRKGKIYFIEYYNKHKDKIVFSSICEYRNKEKKYYIFNIIESFKDWPLDSMSLEEDYTTSKNESDIGWYTIKELKGLIEDYPEYFI